MPKTPIRGIRVPEELWLTAQEKAEIEGTTVSAEVVKFLRWYTRGPETTKPPPPGVSRDGGEG